MRINHSTKIFSILSFALSSVLICSASLDAKDKSEKSEKKQRVRTIVKPDFDPSAEKVELFAAMEDGKLEAFVIPHDQHNGYIFVENKSDQPVSLKLPRTIVAVQNLKQFGMGGGFGGGGGGFGGGQGGGFGGGQGGGGGGQGVGGGGGGGFGGGQGGGGFGGGGGGFGGQGGGGGFFSIPPQHRVRIDLNCVCLEHGKKEPNRTMKYSLIDAEKVIQNDVLMELLAIVSTGEVSARSAQAATWYLTDGMSFQQLAAKQEGHFGGYTTNYFTPQDLAQAQQLLLYAKKKADERKDQPTEEPQTESGYSRAELKANP